MRLVRRAVLLALIFSALLAFAQTTPHFELTFPATLNSEPITGRAFLIVSRSNVREPRETVGSWNDQTPIFGIDVDQLRPAQPAIVDAGTLGFPVRSLRELPAGDYYVQGVLNVYTQVHRSDGRTLWVHLDQGEGQQFNLSPGNLYSQPQRIHFDPTLPGAIRIELTQRIPPIKAPPDTTWVKTIRIQSKLLSQFWGVPIYLGATVLLPRDYDKHPGTRYPTIYWQGHFSERVAFSFRTEPVGDGFDRVGMDFARQWRSLNFPRMIAVTFQHPTPFFDDSYGVNSANNGPYGDAIMTELIPYLEQHFRMQPHGWARLLTGGSTGGWSSLALQAYHPEFFGGTWTFFPDPVDFSRYQLVNIYEDETAFVADGDYIHPERPMMRSVEGQMLVTVRQMSQLEQVLGTRGRSAQQYEAWDAVFGPIGADGYPRPLWDKLTGKIDPEVADYMRDHGYDLRAYLQKNWSRIGRQLVGKLHLYCGDMDNYYLNLAVYRLQDFLESANPPYGGSFQYGRPMMGHGWMPMSYADLVRQMDAHVKKNLPAGVTPDWEDQRPPSPRRPSSPGPRVPPPNPASPFLP